MVNMEMTKEEAKEYGGLCCAGDSEDKGPKYPWGLQISLDDGSLEKLGITELPPVGTTMLVQAQVTVTSASSSQRQSGDVEQRVELQITDMELSPPSSDDKRASRLYGGAGG